MAVRTGLLLWVADAAGPRVFGRLALCVATTELLRIACDFGTQTLFVRRFAQFRLLEEGQKQLIALARFRAVATAVGVGLYLGIVGAVFGATLGRIELLTCALLVTALAISFPLTFFQAKLEVHKAIGPVLGCAVLYIGYFATSYGHSIFADIVGLVVYESVAALILVVMVLKEMQLKARDLFAWKSSVSLLPIVRESLPIMGGTFVSTVYTRVDVFAVKAIAGALALGLYSYAFRLTEPFRYLALAIESSLYSHLASRVTIRSSDPPNFRLIEKLVLTYALAFSVLAYITGIVATRFVFSEYVAASDTILILSCALFFRCVNGYQTAFQNALGKYRLTARFSLVGLVVTCMLIYPLTKWMGFLGAALTLFIMEFVNFLVQRHFYRSALVAIARGTT